MSRKAVKIAARIEALKGGELDAHYLGFFECFNQQLFFEAHEVLEHLWLAQRGSAQDAFYKGLIQLAGAFVHWQKGRWQPAAALLRLARSNLAPYGPLHARLDLTDVLGVIEQWLSIVQGPAPATAAARPPKLRLVSSISTKLPN